MGFLTNEVFGVRLWIILYFFFSQVMLVLAVAFWQRERIRKLYYTVRHPEKVIKVIIHYPTGLYRIFWRIIPPDDIFKLEKSMYVYDKLSVKKEDDFFAVQSKDTDSKIIVVRNVFVKEVEKKGKIKEVIRLGDGEEVTFNKFFTIAPHRGKKYAEIHYIYNNPTPINFNYSTGKLDFSATALKTFKDNDLVTKLLTLKAERNLMMILMFMVIGNLLLSLFIISKMMGWIQ